MKCQCPDCNNTNFLIPVNMQELHSQQINITDETMLICDDCGCALTYKELKEED